jgi:hypothetical protein
MAKKSPVINANGCFYDDLDNDGNSLIYSRRAFPSHEKETRRARSLSGH